MKRRPEPPAATRPASAALSSSAASSHASASAAPAPPPPAAAESVRRLPSEQLFAGATEVHIEHGDALYRLKRTALGKLILTK